MNQFSNYIPQSIQTKVFAAMENDNKSFQLALYELDPETISSISEIAYKAEFSIADLTQLLGEGKEFESASCQMEENVSGKNTYYRVIYKHDQRQRLKISELYWLFIQTFLPTQKDLVLLRRFFSAFSILWNTHTRCLSWQKIAIVTLKGNNSLLYVLSFIRSMHVY